MKRKVLGLAVRVKKLEERVKKLEELLYEEEEVFDFDARDELFVTALEVIQEYDYISTSLVQRRLAVGYVRAVRILDELEEAGYVSPSNESDLRSVVKIRRKRLDN